MPFPGFDTTTGYRSTLVFNSRLERTIRDRDLAGLTSLKPADAVPAVLDLYLAELAVLDEEPGCDVVLIARPDHLPEGLTAETDPSRPWVRARRAAGLNFRAALKGASMGFSRPLQLIRRTTWDPTFRPDDKDTRATQDEATRAWNLHTALYYKSGGVPWRLPRDPAALTSCFVGISFYNSADRATLQTSVAQVFNQRGDGVIIR
jgi:hypothetical protein